MSDFEDMFDNEDEPVLADFRPAAVPAWKTAEGRVMRMSDMAESHVENAKNYTLRRIDDIEGRIRAKAQEIAAEPYMVTFHGSELSRLSEELETAVGALRSLREEAGRRTSRKDEVAALRKEIDESR